MNEGGNTLTTIVLLLSPLVILRIFARRRLDKAVALSILGATLFMPERAWIDPPVFGALDKHAFAAMSAMLGVWIYARPRLKRARPLSGVGLLIPLAVVGALGTVLTNPNALTYGDIIITPMSLGDLPNRALDSVVSLGLPFILGRVAYRDGRSLRTLMIYIAGFALVYSIPTLIEVRLSPQMHAWVYGYAQHSWLQVKRAGGFRPMVFMEHGLAVALFLATSIACAWGLHRQVGRIWRFKPRYAAIYLLVVLVLCKSTGALVFALLGLLILSTASTRAQIRIAMIIGLVTISYPELRAAQLVPTQVTADLAKKFAGEERASSLQFRFDNEEVLLQHGMIHSLFGWGGYGRDRPIDEEGKIAVPDGYWIVTFTQNGWVGVLVSFGLLTFPQVLLYRRLARIPSPQDRALLGVLSIVLALYTADLLINGLFTRVPYLLAGAMIGVLEGIPLAQRRAALAARRAAAVGAATPAPGTAGQPAAS